MPSIMSWFKSNRSVGELVCRPPTQEELNYQVITQIRHGLCERWWRSVGCINDGRLSDIEFNRFIISEKRYWWHWNFNEEMPVV